MNPRWPRRPFLLIDGYNLLLQIHDRRRLGGPGNLVRARQTLIRTLSNRLHPEHCVRTELVFDAPSTGVPPSAEELAGPLTVTFAVNFQTADEHLNTHLAKHPAPRQCLVISSDRQIQNYAKSRGAIPVDSLEWWDSVVSGEWTDDPTATPVTDEPKPEPELTPEERDYWRRLFET